MLPASNRGAGMSMGFPDVCNTPAGPVTVPVPYPNIAMNAMAAPFSPNVLLTMMPALNTGSIIPMTSGDEPGVAHPTIKGPCRYTMITPEATSPPPPPISPRTSFLPASSSTAPSTPTATSSPSAPAAGSSTRPRSCS